MKVVRRINLKSSHHKENYIFYLFCVYEMMDVNQTYCGNQFSIYVSQIIMSNTLYSAVCQL